MYSSSDRLHCAIGEEDGGLGAFATCCGGAPGRGRCDHRADRRADRDRDAGAPTFRIEVGGRSAHGSMRREGISAFEAFLPIYEALRALEQERNRDPDPPSRATCPTPCRWAS